MGAKPVPSASAGLTHRVAVQQKDTVGRTAVLHPQVERVGAVEVDVGLEQSAAWCRQDSAGDPGTAPIHPPTHPAMRLPLASAQKHCHGLERKPRARSPKHCPSRQSSAPSKNPGPRGGKQLLSSTDPGRDKAQPGENGPMGLPRAEARSQSSRGSDAFSQPWTRHKRPRGRPRKHR